MTTSNSGDPAWDDLVTRLATCPVGFAVSLTRAECDLIDRRTVNAGKLSVNGAQFLISDLRSRYGIDSTLETYPDQYKLPIFKVTSRPADTLNSHLPDHPKPLSDYRPPEWLELRSTLSKLAVGEMLAVIWDSWDTLCKIDGLRRDHELGKETMLCELALVGVRGEFLDRTRFGEATPFAAQFTCVGRRYMPAHPKPQPPPPPPPPRREYVDTPAFTSRYTKGGFTEPRVRPVPFWEEPPPAWVTHLAAAACGGLLTILFLQFTGVL